MKSLTETVKAVVLATMSKARPARFDAARVSEVLRVQDSRLESRP